MESIDIQLVVIIAFSYVLFIFINVILPDIEDQGLSRTDWIAIIGIIVAILSIGIPIVVSDRDRRVKEKIRKTNAYDAIMKELDDTDRALNTNLHTATRIGNDIFYRNAFLNADAYDSILYSGFFTEFLPRTQNTLSNFYITLKLRNALLRKISDYSDMFFLNDISKQRRDRWQIESRPYRLTITQYERHLRDNLNLIRQMISEEIAS